jgi:predicted DNA-binding transcriptional regulator AlpA
MFDSILRFPSVRQATGLSRTTIWRLEGAGDFPTRRKIAASAVGWLRSEVEAWIAERKLVSPQRKEAA